MIRNCLINFYKRFKYFFICFGLILLGLLAGAGIFYGGMRITLYYQDADIVNEINQYFKEVIASLKPTDLISLTFIKDFYYDFISIAKDSAYMINVGIALSLVISLFAIYGSYKGSIAIVNYISKRQLRNSKTKHGFVPFIVKLSIGLGFATALVFLLAIWEWSIIVVLSLYIIIDTFEEMISIRYVYFSHIKLREFIFSKKFLNVMVMYLLFQYIILFIASGFWFISPWISLILMIPIYAYSETNIEYTIIDTYKHLLAKNEIVSR